MSACPLIAAADGGATWPWLTSPGALTDVLTSADVHSAATACGRAGFPRVATAAPGADPAAVRAARVFTQAALRRWAIIGRLDDVVLVMSELVTNALEHTVPRPGGWAVRAGLLQVRPGAAILCAVADPSPAPPVPAPPSELAESGRGLRVVEEVSDTWGYTTAPRRGKVVWATFDLPAGLAAV